MKVGRRRLMEWTAASAALMACARAPRRQIVPYVVQPADVKPGRPLHYATAWELDGHAMGLVVESSEGRPIKVEGNPHHPASRGASRAWDQALIASLYDPERATGLVGPGGPDTLDTFRSTFAHKRVALLLPPTSSRSVERLVARLRREIGASVWFHAPMAPLDAWRASNLALGSVTEPVIDASRARVLVSIGSDWLASGPGCVRAARSLVDRTPRARLYAIEGRRTTTGIFSDVRLACGARERSLVAASLAAKVLADGRSKAGSGSRGLAERLRARVPRVHDDFVSRCAEDLLGSVGQAAWIVGDAEPLEVHALAWLVNEALGAREVVQAFPSPILEAGSPSFDMRALEAQVLGGDHDGVIVCDVNAAYEPGLVGLMAGIQGCKKPTAYVGLHHDETARTCQWFVPLAHPLESWGDVRSEDGTASVVQPLIEPIFGGVTVPELLASLLGDAAPSGREITKETLGLSRAQWDHALATGVASPAATPLTQGVHEEALVKAVDAWKLPEARPFEVEIHPSHALYDGRFAGIPWLLELPEPVTKLVWDNAAVISPATAAGLGVVDGDVVSIADVELPVLVDGGTADGVVAVAAGWGRDAGLSKGIGQNALALQGERLGVTKTGRTYELARTQLTFTLDRREEEVVRVRSRNAPPFDRSHEQLALYPKIEPTAPHAWGMAIDLSRCTGCSACVIACQAENNVVTVGKHGVIAGRAMHWLRIDRYDTEKGAVLQPMLCQQCDNAPCEYVCPVNATVHSPDGLNEMVYNRCVGTRFCSNNCPYKVRRFNWFNYHEDEPPLAQLAHNPDVTVRARGVMEKCTFCVQRIREAEHHALAEKRDLARDEVVTACAQACPTRAIVFGDVKDPGSAVSLERSRPEAYDVLGDLGTRPRIKYFPKIIDDGERT